MRVLLDEQIDGRIKQYFDPTYVVLTVKDRRWNGRRNGNLLRAAAAEFDVFVTMDRGIEHQQNLTNLDIGIVLISARSNRSRDLQPLMEEVNAALGTILPGQVIKVGSRR